MQKKKENIQNDYYESLSMEELLDIEGGNKLFDLLSRCIWDLFTSTN